MQSSPGVPYGTTRPVTGSIALEEPRRRYDIGARYGLLIAQLALALDGRDRSEVLAQLVELLATQQMGTVAGRSGQ